MLPDPQIALFGDSSSPVWAGTTDLNLPDGQPARAAPLDASGSDADFLVAIVGEAEPDPVPFVQAAHRLNRDAPIVVLRRGESVAQTRQSLFTAPDIGLDTKVVDIDSQPDSKVWLESVLTRAMNRRRHRAISRDAESRLSSAPDRWAVAPVSVERLMQALPVGVLAVDESQMILMVNRLAKQQLGHAGVDDLRLPWYAPLPDAVASKAEALVQDSMVGERVKPLVLTLDNVAMGERHLEMVVAPRGDDASRGALIILSDVTERVRAEEQRRDARAELRQANLNLEARVGERTAELKAAYAKLEARNREIQKLYGVEAANQAKSRFLSTMSHEIRTPLHAILGCVELMSDSTLDPDQQANFRMIQEAAESLKDLIDDVLDFSKIESGEIELDHHAVSLRSVAESVAGTLAPAARAKGLRLQVFVDPQLPAQVLMDGARLRQVLLNLVGNAVKFTQAGVVALRLEQRQAADGTPRLHGSVRDTGVGIPEEARERVFERFMQAEVSTTRRFGGSGLGLSISRSLIELMDGCLDFESEPDQGSTFWFDMPLPEAVKDAAEGETLRQLAGRRVAIDNPDEQETDDWLRYVEAAGGRGISGQDENADVLVRALEDTAAYAVEVRSAGLTRRLQRPIRLEDLLSAAAPSSAPSQAAAPEQDKRFAGRRALVAEDNEVNQLVIRRQLEKMGIQVTLADDGVVALQELEQTHFDLLLTDLHMPRMDGFELATTVREQERSRPEEQPTCIIALTASVDKSEAEKCHALGMNEVLGKPMSLETLEWALNKYLLVDPEA